MTFVYIGIYLIILAILWGFFIIAKLHSYKFKDFSNLIVPVTVSLFIFLLILSIAGFIMIFFLGSDDKVEVTAPKDSTPIEENYY